MEGYEIFSNARNLYKDGSLFNKGFLEMIEIRWEQMSLVLRSRSGERSRRVFSVWGISWRALPLIQIYILYHSRLLTFLSLFFFSRMEEMVKSMMQYKTKIEQLKQEKSSLSITYEVYICHVGFVHRCDPTDICERDIYTEGTVILSWVISWFISTEQPPEIQKLHQQFGEREYDASEWCQEIRDTGKIFYTCLRFYLFM